MSDTLKPPNEPPPLPLHLVRAWTPRERALDKQLADARAELAAERATVQILRQQYRENESSPQEKTLPGIQLARPAVRASESGKPAMAPRRSGKWALIGSAVIGLAAAVAILKYPGLMGPIEKLAAALTEALPR